MLANSAPEEEELELGTSVHQFLRPSLCPGEEQNPIENLKVAARAHETWWWCDAAGVMALEYHNFGRQQAGIISIHLGFSPAGWSPAGWDPRGPARGEPPTVLPPQHLTGSLLRRGQISKQQRKGRVLTLPRVGLMEFSGSGGRRLVKVDGKSYLMPSCVHVAHKGKHLEHHVLLAAGSCQVNGKTVSKRFSISCCRTEFTVESLLVLR